MRLWIHCLLFASALCADWDPSYCFPDEELNELDDPIYQNLKNDLVLYLKDSWVSEEKVRLLMDLIYITKPEVCVEIGAYSGSSVLPVATTLKYLQKGVIIAIDPWSNAEAIKNMSADDPNKPWWGSVDFNKIYELFMFRIAGFAITPYCEIFQGTSEMAAAFIDEIDFLHLDGDYSEKGSLQDVQLYLPKVKPGGFILLSNLFIMINGKPPKMKAFSMLFDECEMICEIDRDNVVLFRKN